MHSACRIHHQSCQQYHQADRFLTVLLLTRKDLASASRFVGALTRWLDALQAFDELHLLKRGGRTTYAGPTGRESAELISYFEAVPGVPPIQPGMNPATWMLEITAFASEERLGVDFAEIWAQSGLAK